MCRAIHEVANALTYENMFKAYVKLPDNHTPTPPEIRLNAKLYPYFSSARGAIDGSHIGASVPPSLAAACRNRKGFLSQNVLAVVTFDGLFCYIMTGWEGSAADSTIYQDACTKDLSIPPGICYLADAGFPLCNSLLVPYRGVRYHLKEWGQANIRCVVYLVICSLR